MIDEGGPAADVPPIRSSLLGSSPTISSPKGELLAPLAGAG